MLKKFLYGVTFLFLFAAAGIFYQIYANINDMKIDTKNTILPSKYPPLNQSSTSADKSKDESKPVPGPEDFYVLLVGIDYRDSRHTMNTDSMIVAHIIPQNQSLKLLSIPRDLKISDTSGDFIKINSIFAEGYHQAILETRENPSLLSGRKIVIGQMSVSEEYISSGIASLRGTLEKYFDIPIDYTFLINFETVVSLVNEVGGVEINVDRSMQYDAEFDDTHIHLDPGHQLLDGRNALNFARFREDNRGPDFYSNDFERGQRQQQVITALADKLTAWHNLTKVLKLLNIVTDNVKTDMSTAKMSSLIAGFYGHLNSDWIQSIPFNGYWKSPFVDISDEDLMATKQALTSTDEPVLNR